MKKREIKDSELSKISGGSQVRRVDGAGASAVTFKTDAGSGGTPEPVGSGETVPGELDEE